MQLTINIPQTPYYFMAEYKKNSWTTYVYKENHKRNKDTVQANLTTQQLLTQIKTIVIPDILYYKKQIKSKKSLIKLILKHNA